MMNIPGIPGRGANSGNAGMSDQEQLMVKSVCPESLLEVNVLKRGFIDASGHGELPSQDCISWRYGLCFGRDVWSFHVQCMISV